MEEKPFTISDLLNSDDIKDLFQNIDNIKQDVVEGIFLYSDGEDIRWIHSGMLSSRIIYFLESLKYELFKQTEE